MTEETQRIRADKPLVVCIEDEPLTQTLYTSILGSGGYDIETYETGDEALKRLKNVEPDLIIVDIFLPDMSGLDLCDHIRDLQTCRDVPLMIVSADTSQEGVTAGLHKDVIDYITKPFQPSELLAKVGIALNRTLLNQRRERAGSNLFADRYELQHRLGAGSSSVVFRAVDKSSQPPVDVALKIYSMSYLDSDPARTSIVLREAYQMSKLDHPNTIRLVDFGRASDNRLYVAMEFIEGMSLHDLIMTSGPIEPDVAAYIGYEVASTLEYLGKLGIVHRDIKPANIMVTDAGIKVIDFGLTRATSDILPVDQDVIAGTPIYLAPEILTRSYEEHIGSDLYSLGVTLYAALSHRLPFAGKLTEIIDNKLKNNIEPITMHCPHIPGGLADFIHAMIHPDPRQRPTLQETMKILGALMTPTINPPSSQGQLGLPAHSFHQD